MHVWLIYALLILWCVALSRYIYNYGLIRLIRKALFTQQCYHPHLLLLQLACNCAVLPARVEYVHSWWSNHVCLMIAKQWHFGCSIIYFVSMIWCKAYSMHCSMVVRPCTKVLFCLLLNWSSTFTYAHKSIMQRQYSIIYPLKNFDFHLHPI